jgi:hypothetical protein
MTAIDHHSLARPLRPTPARLTAAAGLLALAALAVLVWKVTGSWRLTALTAVGAGLGFTLERSGFGFAGGFRDLLVRRDGAMLKAQVIMFALMSAVAIPLVAGGEAFGLRLVGVVTPVGVAFVIGAVIFGVGMQIGGGCASGTLYGLGQGDLRLAVTLAGFVIGSTLGAAHMGFWWSLPKTEALTLWQSFSLPVALGVQAAILAAIYLALHLFTRGSPSAPRLGRWTLLAGALALAVLNVAVLLLSGQPWGEAPAFALWGSKVVAAYGVDVLWWDYWARPGFDRQIEASVLTDSVTVITLGLVLGALISAAAAGRLRLRVEGGAVGVALALIGGVLMGYGARLTNGCNIGAYFSAVGTGALSGWAWLAFALAGSYLGILIRRLASLDLSRRETSQG